MHFPCLVAGSDPDVLLAPLSQHLTVPRYRHFLDDGAVRQMAEHFDLPAEDLAALAAKMLEWSGGEGGVEGGRLFEWSTENRSAKFDWYQVGGRFAGSLHLVTPTEPAWWQRLFGAKPRERVDRAVKSAVRPEPLLAEPPTAVLVGGAWHECPLTEEPAAIAAWKAEFARLYASLPDDTQLTVVDVHS